MQVVLDIITNKCIYVPFLLWCVVQMYKVITDLVKNKKLNIKRLVGAGGMPSSHAAVVCSLASCVGKQYGFGSGEFAIAIIMACIVMYDAAGVRRAAGKQARVLNKILETPGLTTGEVGEKLVELLGHTPIQVFVGAILGFAVGAIV
ncbi:MAG: divergent PAP2 family protein [Clostridia bacterium]|jgi:hypothetical protein|nr:divergent PAP2 family protein [Clostridia bacterium]